MPQKHTRHGRRPRTKKIGGRTYIKTCTSGGWQRRRQLKRRSSQKHHPKIVCKPTTKGWRVGLRGSRIRGESKTPKAALRAFMKEVRRRAEKIVKRAVFRGSKVAG